MLPLYSLLLPLALLVLIAAAFSYSGWRVLGRHGPWALAAFTIGATLLLAGLGVGRMVLTTPPASPPRPGAIPATFLILAIMFGAAFTGSALGLIRLSRNSGSAPRHPVRRGMIGFFIGGAVPLVYAFGRDVARLL